MKKILSVLLAAVMALAMTACADRVPSGGGPKQEPTTKLAAPQNVAYNAETQLITWSAVENATSYLVTINDKTYEVRQLQRSQSPSADFTYSVAAKADGYETSDPSATQTYKTFVSGVSITGGDTVKSEGTLQLTAAVAGTASDKDVKWSIASGADYATVSQTGLLTAKAVSGADRMVRVRAESVADPTKAAERTVTILAYNELTQAMLDAIGNAEKLEFLGEMTADVYSIGRFETYQRTYTIATRTALDGTYWYAEYTDSASEQKSSFYAKNEKDLACYVSLGYDNNEEYTPMPGEDGQPIRWDEAGLYNNFRGLQRADFAFDDDTFRWEYVGTDDTFVDRMIAAADPYEFSADKTQKLYLTLGSSGIIGFGCAGKDDYSLVPGYKSKVSISCVLNYGPNVEVPRIELFEHGQEHDRLASALENMRDLDSYSIEWRNSMYSVYGNVGDGYFETITPDLCYYRDFVWEYGNNNTTINRRMNGSAYGAKKIDEGLYNTFYTVPSQDEQEEPSEPTYAAERAIAKDFSDAKPSFAFAPELFMYVPTPTSAGQPRRYQYMAYPDITSVAQFFYKSVGTDDYGVFATGIELSVGTVLPYLIVEEIDPDGEEGPAEAKPYIVESGFYYNMGDIMYGFIEIYYTDFDTATLETTVDFETRLLPTAWDEVMSFGVEDEPDFVVETYLTEKFGDGAEGEKVLNVEIPFFGEVLGDSLGFVADDLYSPGWTQQSYAVAAFYYDVPLDRWYSLDTAISELEVWLKGQGFVEDEYGVLNKDRVHIVVADVDLDLWIYVWVTAPVESTP